MTKATFVSIPMLAIALGWALPAQAQSADAAAIQRELAEMRKQMRVMADRIDSLEGQLATANARAEAASQAAASANQSATAAVAAAAKAPPVQVAWKGAPEFSAEGGWSFKPRGRMQIDLGAIAAPDNLAGADKLGVSSRVRRFFLGFEGTLPGGFGYRVESDFGTSAVALNDVYLSYKASKQVTLIAGYHRPFFGLEELTSDLFTSMMERATQSSAFNFERRLGVSAAYSTDTLLAQTGVFTDDALSINDDTAHSWSASGRLVAMPKIGAARLHLGASVNLRDLNGSTQSVRYRARPFLRTTDLRLVDTGAFTATSERDLGAELAFIAGRFHATAESHWLTARRPGRADPTFNGGYAELGYLLTDDVTAYKGSLYERIRPKSPLGQGGIGAVQVNLRYDWLDLDDAGSLGGRQQIAALSLIWMPTDYVRFLANYGHVWTRDAPVTAAGDRDYSADAFGLRAQVDF
jgi:phosphate-selective porin OprO/OprP